jgi:GAF domain-containing protein
MPTETERLQLLYELNRKLAAFTDLDELLHFATRHVRELFEAEGCSLLLHDPATDELYFPVESQRASSAAAGERLRDIRFPASEGIAGWVLAHLEAIAVDDVARDPRFYPGVDATTGVATRSLLCAPLRGTRDVRGVACVVNPASGVGPDDVRFLDAIADELVVAFDRAALLARLKDDARQARWAGRLAGLGLVGFGLVLVVGTAFRHAARALPIAEVVWRLEFWLGAALAVVGGLLLRANREGRGSEITPLRRR